jgi:PAS domain S-box-containing protein
MKNSDKKSDAALLRQKAEELLKIKPTKTAAILPELETLKLIHELEVHQIELEMQNEELTNAKEKSETDGEKYAELYDFAPAGYFTLSKEGEILQLNLTGATMIGKVRSQLVKTQFSYFVSVDTKPVFTAFLEKIFTGNSKKSCEVNIEIHNKEPMYVHLSGIAVENGESCFVTMVDINERKRAEEALKASEEKFRNLFQTMIQGVVYQDADGRIISANPAAERILGLSLDQMQGRSSLDPRWHAIHEDGSDFPGETHPAIEALRTGQPVLNVIMGVFHPKAGNYIWINVNAMPLFKRNETAPYQVHATFDDITVRKHAEEAMRESNDRFNALFYNVPLQCVIYRFIRDEHGEIVDWEFSDINPLGAASIGKDAVDVIGKRASEVFGSDAMAPYFEISRQIAKSKEPHQFETQFTANGRNYLSSVFLVGTEHYANVSVDITAHTRMEIALRESKDQINQLLQTTDQCIYGIDLNGCCTFINKSGLNTLGYKFEECVGKNMHTLIHHSHSDGSPYPMEDCPIFKAKLTGIGHKMDSEVMWRKDGTSFPAEYSSFPVIQNGNIRGAVVTFSDITERKQAEESLKESEEKYRLLYESNQMPIAIFAAETLKFLSVNNAFVEKYGYTKEEFLTMTILEIRPDSERERVKQSVNTIDKGLVNLGEYLHKKKNGEIIHVEIIRNDLIFEGKKAKLVFANDITDRKNSEQALRQAQKLESIGTLAGGIAHDFNNLMNAVLGQSALALNKLPKESPAVDHISKAIKASERVADLTKQLLAYSGRGKFVIDEIDLNKLVKENVAMLEVSIPKTTQLQFELGSPSPHIIGDIGQIQQVIMNLIINAGEAMGSNPGYITVQTNRIVLSENTSEYSKYTGSSIAAGNYAMLQIKDNGSGISEKTLMSIFDPFFTTKFTGRGLGLAAVLGIIKGHKGGLRIESEVGKGTMFEIVWPLVEPSKIFNSAEKKAIIVNGEGKTVLVIDDEASVIELLDDVLTDFNFNVIGAVDPLKGIELYRQHHQNISLVILDYSMPHMDGKDAFEKLIQINKNIKVILCSGYTEEETMSVFGIDRPTGFFHKPYDTEELVRRVGEIVLKDL